MATVCGTYVVSRWNARAVSRQNTAQGTFLATVTRSGSFPVTQRAERARMAAGAERLGGAQGTVARLEHRPNLLVSGRWQAG